MDNSTTTTTGRARNGVRPPSRWACPRCGASVVTHIPTFIPECRNRSHGGDVVFMEARS